MTNVLCAGSLDSPIPGKSRAMVGLVNDLRYNQGLELEGRRILLMGAGGAARGVLLPLLQTGLAELFIVNRTAARAEELAGKFPEFANLAAGGYAQLAGRHFDGVINATAAGLADELPPLPEDIILPGGWAYDLMYGKDTPFMGFARRRGVRVADGLGMLVEQAAEAFFLWRGVRPETAPVIRQLRGA